MAKSRELVVLSALLIATPISACARKNGGFLPLSPPAAPEHDVSGIDPGRASRPVDGRLDRRDERGRASSSPAMSGIAGVTDRADSAGRAKGTSWSVVIESAPGTPNRKSDPAPKRPLDDAPLEAAPTPARPTWQRWFDVVGGSVASVCCVLALRRRTRRSPVRSAR